MREFRTVVKHHAIKTHLRLGQKNLVEKNLEDIAKLMAVHGLLLQG
jgi:hypothetical protein